jgi:hypothetical protein
MHAYTKEMRLVLDVPVVLVSLEHRSFTISHYSTVAKAVKEEGNQARPGRAYGDCVA